MRTVDGRLRGFSATNGATLWTVEQSLADAHAARQYRAARRRHARRSAASTTVASVPTRSRTAILRGKSRSRIPRGAASSSAWSTSAPGLQIVGNDVYVVGYHGRAVGIDLATGVVLWQQDLSSYAGLGADLNNVYVTNEFDAVIALDREAGTQVWRQELLRLRDVTAPTRYANTLVVGDYEGYLHWLSPDDGSFLARERAAGAAHLRCAARRRAERLRARRRRHRGRVYLAPRRTSVSRAAMLPAVALVGRPNVGKSTLFNRLTATRDALVADFPGLDARPPLRHRPRGRPQIHRHRHRRPGLDRQRHDDGARRRAGRARDRGSRRGRARRRSQAAGSRPRTPRIAERFRRESKPVVIAVNKAEGVAGEIAEAEFHALGVGCAGWHLGRPRAGCRRAARDGARAVPRRRRTPSPRRRAGPEGRGHRPAERRQVDVDQSPAR